MDSRTAWSSSTRSIFFPETQTAVFIGNAKAAVLVPWWSQRSSRADRCLPRALLHASSIPEGVDCRNNDFAGPAVDEADGTERDAGEGRLSLQLPISIARSGCKILRRV